MRWQPLGDRDYEVPTLVPYRRGEAQVAPGNLQLVNDDIQQQCPLLGQRVVLRGLTTATLNGTRGTAVDFGFSEEDPDGKSWVTASGRYTVRLDGPEGRRVKVRAANVEKEESEGGAGPGDGGGRGGGGGGGKKGAGKGRRK